MVVSKSRHACACCRRRCHAGTAQESVLSTERLWRCVSAARRRKVQRNGKARVRGMVVNIVVAGIELQRAAVVGGVAVTGVQVAARKGGGTRDG